MNLIAAKMIYQILFNVPFQVENFKTEQCSSHRWLARFQVGSLFFVVRHDETHIHYIGFWHICDYQKYTISCWSDFKLCVERFKSSNSSFYRDLNQELSPAVMQLYLLYIETLCGYLIPRASNANISLSLLSKGADESSAC